VCHFVLTEQPLWALDTAPFFYAHFAQAAGGKRGGFNLPNENNLGSKWQHLLLPLPLLPLRQIE